MDLGGFLPLDRQGTEKLLLFESSLTEISYSYHRLETGVLKLYAGEKSSPDVYLPLRSSAFGLNVLAFSTSHRHYSPLSASSSALVNMVLPSPNLRLYLLPLTHHFVSL